MRELKFYTDGAYSSKTQMGGWAAICIEDDEIIDTQRGYEPYTTNNRMEQMAFLSALENIDTIETKNTKVTIFTDSAYISNCFKDGWYKTWLSNGWKTADKKDVKNQDLWVRILALYIKHKNNFNLKIEKVQAHKNDMWNHYVDALAVKSRKELEED